MNTHTTTHEEVTNTTQASNWTADDTVRVGRLLAGAVLLGLILKVMAVAAPTPVAARENPPGHAEVVKSDTRK